MTGVFLIVAYPLPNNKKAIPQESDSTVSLLLMGKWYDL